MYDVYTYVRIKIEYNMKYDLWRFINGKMFDRRESLKSEILREIFKSHRGPKELNATTMIRYGNNTC